MSNSEDDFQVHRPVSGRTKKVLIPFPARPDSFQDNVAHTFRCAGWEVLTPPRQLDQSGHRLLDLGMLAWRKAHPHTLTGSDRWIIGAVRNWRPDLLLCLTQSVRPEVLAEVRSIGVPHLVAWWGDAPANMKGMGLLADGWDAIFIKDAAAVAKFRAVGLPALHLHEAMNPIWHRRAFESIGEETVVAGNFYGYRQFLVQRLLEAGESMALYGPPPPRWASLAIRNGHRGQYIVKEDKSRIFGSALACLNSTSLSEGDSLNCRAFEIAGACGLQLIEDKPAVSQCFEPGREVLTYRSVEEIVAHLEHARRDPLWALKVREAGYQRALAEHTYQHRITTILSSLGLRFG